MAASDMYINRSSKREKSAMHMVDYVMELYILLVCGAEPSDVFT